MKGKRAKTICLYSPKGGTGKSGLVMSLGAVMSLKNKKVLLVDYDLFNGGLCMLVNQNITKSIFTFSDDYNNNRFKGLDHYVYSYNEYIDILVSPKDPRQASKIDSKYISKIIEKAYSEYDYIIFDTSIEFNENNIIIMDNVDLILFVMTNEPLCVKNMRNVITMFNDLKIKNYRVLLNNTFYKNGFFKLNEIKKIIDTNVDYVISNSFYIKEFNGYLYDGKLPILNESINKKHRNDIKNIELIMNDLSKEEADN